MSKLENILKSMADNKNIKTISVELKRMSGGIKITYETRIGDETKMGLEFVNAKDFETDKSSLLQTNEKVLDNILNACETNKT